jgi:hypothetical protein
LRPGLFFCAAIEMINLKSICQLLLALTANAAAAQNTPPETADSVLGIHLNVPLESQMSACPIGPDGRAQHLPDKPCWCDRKLSPTSTVRDVLFPDTLLSELGLVTVRNLREAHGVVVEVEAEFMSDDVKRIGRYLMQRKGPPAENKKADRQSRVFGIRKFMIYSWYSADSGLHFLELASSEHPSLRGYNKRWADEENAWQEELRNSRDVNRAKPVSVP